MDSVILTTQAELEALIAKVLNAHLSSASTSPAAAPKEIINTSVLCARLGITEPTVINWRKKGKLPFLQIGTAIRYDWTAVVKALENKQNR